MHAQGLEYAIIGGIRRDYYILPQGETYLGVLGGHGVYAAAAARLWSDSVLLLCRVGSDFPASLLEEISRHGLNLEGIRRLDQPLECRRFFTYLSPEERLTSNPAAHFLRAGHSLPKDLIDYPDPAESRPDRQSLRPEAFHPDDLPSQLTGTRAAHFCPDEYLSHVLTPIRLRELGVSLITLDVSETYVEPRLGSELRDLISGLDALLLSEEEATGFFRPEEPDLWEMAEALGAMGCRFVVIKRGPGGAYAWDREAKRRWHIPAYPARVVDPTGAGDGYCGGFLVGLDRTQDVAEAALWGSVSASFTIEGIGALYAADTLPGLARARLEALRPLGRQV
jgi:sugar/nucleoside kinase (ribokinase family)